MRLNIAKNQDKFIKMFKKELKVSCEHIIGEFAKTSDNREVYAFAIDADPDHGSVAVWINNEESLKNRITETYPDYRDYKIKGLNGLRYSPADFKFSFFQESFTDKLNTLLQEYYDFMINDDSVSSELRIEIKNRFVKSLLNVNEQLRKSFKKIDMVEHFISYVSLHDIDLSTMEKLMRASISEDTFNVLFPEVGSYEMYLKGINDLSKEDQVLFWLQIMKDHYLNGSSVELEKLIQLGKSCHDAQENLVQLAEYSNVILVDEICRLGRMKEINYISNLPILERIEFMKSVPEEEKYKYKAWTNEAELNHRLISALIEGNILSDESLEKLLDLQSFLYKRDNDLDKVGLNLSLTSRAINRLSKGKYPKEDICSSTNKLLNYDAFKIVRDV